ncbi:MAG: hypothetical protein QXP36_14735 [Conexivisphaerales archaeon]
MKKSRSLAVMFAFLSVSLFAFGLYGLATAAYIESFLSFVCYILIFYVLIFKLTDET